MQLNSTESRISQIEYNLLNLVKIDEKISNSTKKCKFSISKTNFLLLNSDDTD
ncbi:hypothetical protein PSFL107428_08320 [Pseudoalteromonas maricaloris]